MTVEAARTESSDSDVGSVASRPGYGQAAVGGSAWAILQVLVSKFVSLIGSVIVSWILVPSDIGLAALAFATLSIPILLSPSLLSDILIQRKDEARELARAATRLAWWSGAIGAIVASAVAPIIAYLYKEPALLLLMPLATLRHLASSGGIAALSRLRLDLRFRDIARVGNVAVVVANASSIGLALLGLGPASIILGQVLANITSAIGHNRLSRATDGGDARRWRELVRPYLALSCAQWIHGLSVVAGTLCLGLVVTTDVVGLFSFAFALSAQVNTILAYNIGIVLQPIFSHLQDNPARQTQGFIRACSIMAAIATPVSLAQAAVATPLLRCVYADQWMPAAPALAILSVAQLLGFAAGPTNAILKAQGRFRTLAYWQAAQTLVLVGSLFLLSSRFGLIGAAAALAIQSAVFGPLGIWLVTHGRGGSLASALGILLRPLLAGLPIFASIWYLAERHASSTGLAWAILLGGPVVGVSLYVVLFRFVDPATFHDARRILSGLISRVRRVKPGAT
jgi:O-antigen/teichoic acid export membrane protein